MDLLRNRYQLPASAIAETVNEMLKDNPSVVITAPPGAGKSTLLPLTILEGLLQSVARQSPTHDKCTTSIDLLTDGKILVLEPRRIAARQIAMRMADILGEKVGETVGYRVRFENKVTSETRIEVVTEGILTRMLVADPTLDGVAVVIFDEYHERNLHSDVALALTREAQSLIRPDLRIVVMSATIDSTNICKQLKAPLVESEGRMFPVEIIRNDKDTLTISSNTPDSHTISEAVARTIIEAHRRHDGDILAFLPGQAEIIRCKELLADTLKGTTVCPLYGQLSVSEQHRAISASREGERKVVLATNIAETSLTIEGVRIVIDSGFYRKLVYDGKSGLSHLETVRISLDMATQRSGRAGRVAEGICYRLWTLATEHRMAENRTPEILEADLAPMILDIAAWQGCADVDTISQMQWITPPPTAKVAQACTLLTMLGALDDNAKLTQHGSRLSNLPCHPRIAQMMTVDGHAPLATDIAAILEERDFMPSENDCDMYSRIAVLRETRSKSSRQKTPSAITSTHSTALKPNTSSSYRPYNHLRIAEQYRRMMHVEEDNTMPDGHDVGALIALAFPERIARNDGLGRCRLANGETAVINQSDALASCEWISIANLNAGGRVFLASEVDPTSPLLQPLVRTHDNVSWNSKQGMVIAQREQRIGQLIIGSRPLHNINKEDITSIICEAARKDGRSMFDFNETVQNLQLRVATVSEWHPELSFPDLSTDAVLLRAQEWLPFYIGKATTAAELRKIDLTEALWSLLTYEQQQIVDRLAPTHLQVPTGSRIRLEYRIGAEFPVLRVRLQECFGLSSTPRVDDGKRPVLLELLSPGFKPVQLTQDLSSFWQNTYFEVRKELRRRYPKHYWPDNPLEAAPTRSTKRTS